MQPLPSIPPSLNSAFSPLSDCRLPPDDSGMHPHCEAAASDAPAAPLESDSLQEPLPYRSVPRTYWDDLATQWRSAKEHNNQLELFAPQLPDMLSEFSRDSKNGRKIMTAIFDDFYYRLTEGEIFLIDAARDGSSRKAVLEKWRDALEQYIRINNSLGIEPSPPQLMYTNRLVYMGKRLDFVKECADAHSMTGKYRERGHLMALKYYVQGDLGALTTSQITQITAWINAQLEKGTFIGKSDTDDFKKLLVGLILNDQNDNKVHCFHLLEMLLERAIDEQTVFTTMRELELGALKQAAHTDAETIAFARLLQTLAYKSRINTKETNDSLKQLRQKMAPVLFAALLEQQEAFATLKAQGPLPSDTRIKFDNLVEIERHLLSVLIQMDHAQYSLNLWNPNVKKPVPKKSVIEAELNGAYTAAKKLTSMHSQQASNSRGKKGTRKRQSATPLRSYLSIPSDDLTVRELKLILLGSFEGRPYQGSQREEWSQLSLMDKLDHYLNEPYFQTNQTDLNIKEIIRAFKGEDPDVADQPALGALLYQLYRLENPQLDPLRTAVLSDQEDILYRDASKFQQLSPFVNAIVFSALFRLSHPCPDIATIKLLSSCTVLHTPWHQHALKSILSHCSTKKKDGGWCIHNLEFMDKQLAWHCHQPIWHVILQVLWADMHRDGFTPLPQHALDDFLDTYNNKDEQAAATITTTFDEVSLLCKIAGKCIPTYANRHQYLNHPAIEKLIIRCLLRAPSATSIPDKEIGALINILLDAGMDQNHPLGVTLRHQKEPARWYLEKERLPQLNAAGRRLFPEIYASFDRLIEGVDSLEVVAAEQQAWIGQTLARLQAEAAASTEEASSSSSCTAAVAAIHAQYHQDRMQAYHQAVADFETAAADISFQANSSMTLTEMQTRFSALQDDLKALSTRRTNTLAAIEQRRHEAIQIAVRDTNRLEAFKEKWKTIDAELEAAYTRFNGRLTKTLARLQSSREKEALRLQEIFESVQHALDRQEPIEWEEADQTMEAVRKVALERLQHGGKERLDGTLSQEPIDNREEVNELHSTIRKQRKELKAKEMELTAKDREIERLRQLIEQAGKGKTEAPEPLHSARFFTQPELIAQLRAQTDTLAQVRGEKYAGQIRKKLEHYIGSPSKERILALYTACGMQKTNQEGSHMKYQFFKDDGTLLADGSDTIAAHGDELCPKATIGGLRQVATILDYLTLAPQSGS